MRFRSHAWMLMAVLLATAQALSASAQALSDDERALHVLNRLAYGPRADDLERVRQSGVAAYIDAQLHPQQIALPPDLQARLASLSAYQLTPAQLFVQYGPPSFAPDSATAEQKNSSRQRAARELTPQIHLARLWQASESPRQLQEVMTEFWCNHFNVFEGKAWVRYWNGDFEKNAIRPNALGHFRQLLGSVAHHPAMLYYLDNWLSSGAGSAESKGRFKGLNENYARELLELHTLGVNGGYTQADVMAMARILSGWTIDEAGMRRGATAASAFNPRRHDASAQQLLGHTLAAGEQQQGERALDLLAAQPSTARFISTKLVQYFVADQADSALVDQLARRFQSSDGDIAAVLKVLFDSPQFWARANYQTQFKTPYQFVISSLRASATPVRNSRAVDNVLNGLGMPLYGWLTPDGYSYAQAVWLNPDALLRRINFASTLGNGKSPIARAETVDATVPASMTPMPMQTPTADMPTPVPSSVPVALNPQQLLQTLGPTLSAEALAQINSAPRKLQLSLILGSPAFMKR